MTGSNKKARLWDFSYLAVFRVSLEWESGTIRLCCSALFRIIVQGLPGIVERFNFTGMC